MIQYLYRAPCVYAILSTVQPVCVALPSFISYSEPLKVQAKLSKRLTHKTASAVRDAKTQVDKIVSTLNKEITNLKRKLSSGSEEDKSFKL